MVAILSTSYYALHLQISIPSPINCILEHSSFLSPYHNHRVFLHQLPPCPFFQALFFIIMSLLKSLSSYLKKKNKSSSSIYILTTVFLQPKFLKEQSTVFSTSSLHALSQFPKNFINTAFANIISNLLFMKQIHMQHLCRSTLLSIHSYFLDFHAILLRGFLPLSIYVVLPLGSVYNLAGHSSTSSTNPFQNIIFPWLQLPTLYYFFSIYLFF